MAVIERAAIKAQAKAALTGKWGESILVILIYSAIVGVAQSTGIGGLLCTGPLLVGLSWFYINLVEGQNTKIDLVFEGFNACFVNSFVAYLVSSLLIGLGMLVIVPGIILALNWSQYPFILKENPQMDGWDALKRSRDMMQGHRWEFFVLGLSFFGWGLLVLITFGLAALYVSPYMQATYAAYYSRLKEGYQGA